MTGRAATVVVVVATKRWAMLVSKPSAQWIAYPVSRLTSCGVAVRLRTWAVAHGVSIRNVRVQRIAPNRNPRRLMMETSRSIELSKDLLSGGQRFRYRIGVQLAPVHNSIEQLRDLADFGKQIGRDDLSVKKNGR